MHVILNLTKGTLLIDMSHLGHHDIIMFKVLSQAVD